MTGVSDILITGYGWSGGEAGAVLQQVVGGGAPLEGHDANALPLRYRPMGPLDLERAIPQRADRRAMGPSMHAGVCAAGKALEMAGLTGDGAALAETDLITACRCPERDEEGDEEILAAGLQDENGSSLNGALMSNIRPSLFLAQLPNILSANISIVHGVVGTSQTLLGEEMAGAQAIATAFRRVASGRAKRVLVGGASAANPVMLGCFAAGGLVGEGEPGETWNGGGMVLGSGSAFLVLESSVAARARGARAAAVLRSVLVSDDIAGGDRRESADRLWEASGGAPVVLAAPSGAPEPTRTERAFWDTKPEVKSAHAVTNTTGALLEAMFPASIVLGCAYVRGAAACPPADRVACSTWGLRTGHALAILENPDACSG